MTTFYLVRHAERAAPESDLLPGRMSGIRLTEHGKEQAGRVAALLSARGVDRIMSSPLERALETAEPLAGSTGLEVRRAEGLNEFDFGEWTGKRVRDLDSDPVWRRFNQFRSATRIPGGESAIEVQRRFVSELMHLHEQFAGQRIACFSHGDPIRFALLYFLGGPLDLYERIEIDLGSVSTIDIAEWGVRVLRVNEQV